MFLALIVKDLKRLRNNPWQILIFLTIPLLLTGLIGLAFAPKGDSQGLGKIQLGIVDEDDSLLGGFLRSAGNQGEANEYIEPQVLERIEAERLLKDNKLSAIIIIPEGFTDALLDNADIPAIELIKNPAQSFHPAITEELLGILAEGLSAVSSVLSGELQTLKSVFDDDEFDYRTLSSLIEESGDKLEGVSDYIFPPLISYDQNNDDSDDTEEDEEEKGPMAEIFAYVMPGLSAMFLLILGDGATRDLYKELRYRTLDRYRTFRSSLIPFIASKIVYSVLVMLLGGVILFGTGQLLFGIVWNHPALLLLQVIAFSTCGSGLMAFIASLARAEKKADVLNSLVVFGMAFVGGSMVPIEALPGFIAKFVSPLTPIYWFVKGTHQLQYDSPNTNYLLLLLGLTLSGLLLTVMAAWQFNRVLRKGIRS